jgi:hypothetical protein
LSKHPFIVLALGVAVSEHAEAGSHHVSVSLPKSAPFKKATVRATYDTFLGPIGPIGGPDAWIELSLDLDSTTLTLRREGTKRSFPVTSAVIEGK